MSFCGSQPVSIFSVSAKEANKVLQQIARQACYQLANARARKDFLPTKRIFDFHQTTALLHKLPREPDFCGVSQKSRLESVLIGGTLTNDRLAASGWVASAECRFCGHAKESLSHLVFDCHHVHSVIGKPRSDELGQNFAMLGHVEHPVFIAKRRLQISWAADLEVPGDFDINTCQRMWTDGSLVHGQKFWLATAAFAVVNANHEVVRQGLVNHWALSAYAAEVWAIIVTCVTATTKLQIFSDCETAVKHANIIVAGSSVPPTWICQEWWRKLAHVVALRTSTDTRPFEAQWIPAHCFEHVPDALWTEDLARCKQTTVEHIYNNRLCDRAAKQLAQRLSPVDCQVQIQADQIIERHQRWLIELHSMLPTPEAPPSG